MFFRVFYFFKDLCTRKWLADYVAQHTNIYEMNYTRRGFATVAVVVEDVVVAVFSNTKTCGKHTVAGQYSSNTRREKERKKGISTLTGRRRTASSRHNDESSQAAPLLSAAAAVAVSAVVLLPPPPPPPLLLLLSCYSGRETKVHDSGTNAVSYTHLTLPTRRTV